MMKKIMLVMGIMLLCCNGLFAQNRPLLRGLGHIFGKMQPLAKVQQSRPSALPAARPSTQPAARPSTAPAAAQPQTTMMLVQASMFEKAVVEEVNKARARAHLKPLELDESQCASARWHCRFMASHGLQHAAGFMECIAMYPTRSKQESDVKLEKMSAKDESILKEPVLEVSDQENSDSSELFSNVSLSTPAEDSSAAESDAGAAEPEEIDPVTRQEARNVVNLWLNSPPHRAIIMSNVSKIAIGRFGAWHTLRVW